MPTAQLSAACITDGFEYTIDIYMKGYIEIDREFCKGCELCVQFCPKGFIVLSDKLNANGYRFAACVKDGECSGCAICALVCPEVAIEVYRD
jgi:2-oxoglutarate ferredoxin oxidoreductase subunit delta